MEQIPGSAGHRWNGLIIAAGSVSAAIAISRVLGLVREMVLARYFGAGLQSDAFNIAFRIPNLLRDLFAEGALSSAFVPTFIRTLTHGGKDQAWLLTNRVLSALLVILSGDTLLTYMGARLLVWLLAAHFLQNPEKFELTVQMTRIVSPFLLCVAIASIGMGVLNACGSFFVPAMASSAFNISCILSGIFLSPIMPRWGLDPVVSMATGALIGGVTQFLVMIPSAHRMGYRFRFDLDLTDPGLRRIGRLMLPAIVGLSATQINITVDSQIASSYGDGPISYLSYGFRLMQFPIGIFGIAIATVTMTSVSRLASINDINRLKQTIRSGLRLTACLTFPATVGLIIFRHEIVGLLYERGSFTAFDTMQTSRVVYLYALGLFSYSAVKILVPVFYAMEDTWTPVRNSVLTVAAKICLNFILIINFGFTGLVLSTTMASWINCGMLIKQLRGKTGKFHERGELQVYFRIAAASFVMGLSGWLAFRAAWLIIPGLSTLAQAFRLGMAILASCASILPLLRLFGVRETDEIIQKIRFMMRPFV